ncbi:sulfatase-like hydrolase/transferase [candidate division KSB1 bacterium]|nr:sulfatase-like hydrolase/transferase [candidate division KSB1 bacterium]
MLNRRTFLRKSGQTLAAVIAGQLACTRKKRTGPNLLFVFADQFRKQAMGFMNEDPVITPNFDRFAEQSLTFTNAVSTTPLCSPYRAMLMTGRFPMSTGVICNCAAGIDFGLRKEEVCIGDVLKASGYQTGYIGKWHLENPSVNLSRNPIDGATGWDAWTPPGPRRHGFDFWYAYNTSNDFWHPHYWKDSPQKIEIENQWSVEHETGIAMDFIRNRKPDQPFALFVSWNPPHPPYVAPQKYIDMYQDKELPVRPNATETEHRLPYYAAVTSCDDQFGRLMRFLDEQNLAENTIVVFTSDHGESMMSHGLMSKSWWYEEANGIPFMIRMPGKIKPRKTNMPFAVYNFMPTLLGIMDLAVPKTAEGDDLSGFVLGRDDKETDYAFIAHYPQPGDHRVIDRLAASYVQLADDMKKEGIDWRKWGYRGLKSKRYTYVVDRRPDGIQEYHLRYQDRSLGTEYKGNGELYTVRLLYDNINDPYQMNPVVAKEADEHPVMQQLDRELQKWLNRSNDPFPL